MCLVHWSFCLFYLDLDFYIYIYASSFHPALDLAISPPIRSLLVLLLFEKRENHFKLLSRPKCTNCINCQQHLMSAIICFALILCDNHCWLTHTHYTFIALTVTPSLSLKQSERRKSHWNFCTHFAHSKISIRSTRLFGMIPKIGIMQDLQITKTDTQYYTQNHNVCNERVRGKKRTHTHEMTV